MFLLMTGYSRLSSFAQLITLVVIFVFVLLLTYVSTRWMAKLQKNQHKCSNIQVMETFRISNTKYIQILKIGAKYIVIAVCKENVTFLTELKEEELDIEHLTRSMPELTFQEVFQKVKGVQKLFDKSKESEENENNEEK